MTPEIFTAVIAETRRKYRLPTNYRTLNESACIYNFIPGQGNRRFCSNSRSMIEEIIEIIIEANRAGLEQKEVVELCYHLISRQVGTNIYWNKAVGERIAENCASVILKPDYFLHEGRPVYKPTMPTLNKSMKKQHNEIFDYLYKATQLNVGPSTWCTQEAKEAIKLIVFCGADSSDIPRLMNQLMECASAFEGCLSVFELAAYIHIEIIRIHPYVDGNGRVARALMNTVLTNAGYSAIDIKTTKALENEYDHVVSRMDFRGFSTWLQKIYLKQNQGMFLMETQNFPSVEEEFDVLDQIDSIPPSLTWALSSYTKKTPGMFFRPTPPSFNELSSDLRYPRP